MAVRDGLTSLYNHRYFQETLALEVARSRRAQKPCSVIFIDVDNFKVYNDTHGHPEGDQLLKVLARMMMSNLRGSDLAARYGGEEFVLLLPETPKEAALMIAEGLRRVVEEYAFPGGEKQPLGYVSISIGVGSFPLDGAEPAELMAHADAKLYEAKHGGKNTVRG